MKQLFLLLLISISLSAMDEIQIREFVRGSVTDANAGHLGFYVGENIDNIVLGQVVPILDINNDSLKTYPLTGFSSKADQGYVPVSMNGSVRCFVIVDGSGVAVSLGYRKLAEEMNKISDLYNLPFEAITLFRSTQINSYLFSVPSVIKSEKNNLTVLQADWEQSRTGFTTEADIISQIRSAGVQ